MKKTTDTLFIHDSIDCAFEFVSEHRFFLKDIPIEIIIRLERPIGADGIYFKQSHFIQTPLQAGPYATSRPWNDDEMSALRQVVTAFTTEYTTAVSKGHQPSKEWLVANENF